jgi:type II secretory ATPase GspE/PulE/Tfp pilus assembly ATPase PilB-like protein
LSELGFWGTGLELINYALSLKNGLILVSGASDCGKSTTIASMLSSINQTEISIATLEDQIEYKIPGIAQTQINPKTNLNFINGLRILLKQDNDIIMLSELTDSMAISEALEAVSHRKLLISSLHASSASNAVVKLMNYQISKESLTYSLRIVINQRLVKKLCNDCKKLVTLDKTDSNRLREIFNISNKSNVSYIHELEKSYYKYSEPDKKINSRSFASNTETIKKIWVNNPKGCKKCNHSGYNGRTLIYEVLKNSDVITNLIVAGCNDILINKEATKEGMINLLVDGLVKVLVGVTSLDEICKIAKTANLT